MSPRTKTLLSVHRPLTGAELRRMSQTETCPGCGRDLIEADGEHMVRDRRTCYHGAGDVCADGQLWCLDCLAAERCPCVVMQEDD